MKLTMESFQKLIYSLTDRKSAGVMAVDANASQIPSEPARSLIKPTPHALCAMGGAEGHAGQV